VSYRRHARSEQTRPPRATGRHRAPRSDGDLSVTRFTNVGDYSKHGINIGQDADDVQVQKRCFSSTGSARGDDGRFLWPAGGISRVLKWAIDEDRAQGRRQTTPNRHRPRRGQWTSSGLDGTTPTVRGGATAVTPEWPREVPLIEEWSSSSRRKLPPKITAVVRRAEAPTGDSRLTTSRERCVRGVATSTRAKRRRFLRTSGMRGRRERMSIGPVPPCSDLNCRVVRGFPKPVCEVGCVKIATKLSGDGPLRPRKFTGRLEPRAAGEDPPSAGYFERTGVRSSSDHVRQASGTGSDRVAVASLEERWTICAP